MHSAGPQCADGSSAAVVATTRKPSGLWETPEILSRRRLGRLFTPISQGQMSRGNHQEDTKRVAQLKQLCIRPSRIPLETERNPRRPWPDLLIAGKASRKRKCSAPSRIDPSQACLLSLKEGIGSMKEKKYTNHLGSRGARGAEKEKGIKRKK